MRWLVLFALGVSLTACAPAPTRTATPTTSAPVAPLGELPVGFRASFSDSGVVWVSAGRACVARAPSFRPLCPKLPPVIDVAWNAGRAWAAVPSTGAAYTLDSEPLQLQVGRAALLSQTRIYREDGSALNYDGQMVRGVAGTPSAVISAQGKDYAIVAGKLRSVDEGTVLDNAPRAYLLETLRGVDSASSPSLSNDFGRYVWQAGQLQKLGAQGQVLTKLAHPAALLGQVGQTLVTITPAGTIKTFDFALNELPLP